MERHGNGLYSAEIPHVAATVFTCVAIQCLLPVSPPLRSDPVTVARYGCKVTGHPNNRRARFCFANQRYRSAIGIVTVDPFKTRRVAIHFIQRRLTAIKAIEVLYPSLQPAMERIGQ